jgi:hypothetical protein
MAWEKHTKKVSKMHDNNVKLDMETMQRFREILDNIKDKDVAIEFEFLKDYLRLRPNDMDAMDELKIKMNDVGDVAYRSIIDETDQKIYLIFSSPQKE